MIIFCVRHFYLHIINPFDDLCHESAGPGTAQAASGKVLTAFLLFFFIGMVCLLLDEDRSKDLPILRRRIRKVSCRHLLSLYDMHPLKRIDVLLADRMLTCQRVPSIKCRDKCVISCLNFGMSEGADQKMKHEKTLLLRCMFKMRSAVEISK